MKRKLLVLFLVLALAGVAHGDVNISQLPPATDTNGADLVPFWQGGVTKQISLAGFLNWLKLTNKSDKYVNDYAGADGEAKLAAALTAIGANAASLHVDTNITITSNRTIPSNVNLTFRKGILITINAGVRLTISGTISDCYYQIFNDLNTYNYATRTITGVSGAPSSLVFTLAGHGFVNGDQVYFTADTYDHNYANVSDVSGDTFRLKYPNGSYVTGSFTSNNITVALKESFGVKFVNSQNVFVRPEWWGGGPLASATANNIAFNHAVHNTYMESTANITTLLPVHLGPFDYQVNGRIYILSGTYIKGAGMGFAGPFMGKTTIFVSDSTPTVDSFFYVYDMGECHFSDFNLFANNSITCSKGFDLGGHFWKANGTKFSRISVINFSGWAIYGSPTNGYSTCYMTRIENCSIGSNGNGVRLEADSEIYNTNLAGGATGIGIQSVGAQIRNCNIEVWGTGIDLPGGGNLISGCLIKQIADTSTGYAYCINMGNIGTDQIIVNNIFSTSYTGINCAGPLVTSIIQGNTFDYMGHGAATNKPGYAISAKSFKGCVITANRFSNSRYGVFNPTLIVDSGSYPGQIYDNIGVDIGQTVTLTPTSDQTWHPMAYFANRFVTNNTSAVGIQDFFRSGEEGREISITLGEANTYFKQWGSAVTGQLQKIIGYSVGGGWDATNHYYTNAGFTLFSSPAQVNDAVYISDDGGGDPYDRKLTGVKLNIGTASAGNTVVAEYWDGYAWATLPTSGADIFGATGWQQVTWMPPPNSTYTYPNIGVTVNASSKTFTLDDTNTSWLNPYNLDHWSHPKVGDYIVTSGFSQSGNNGKFLVTDVSRLVITVADPGNVLVSEDDTSCTIKKAGWTYANLNAIPGLPATPPSFSGFWMRLRVTVAAGGQCTIGNQYPQYNYINLKEGDFGPVTDNTKDYTIKLKNLNGAWVEVSRSDVGPAVAGLVKGSLIGFSAADTPGALAPGNDGDVLTWDSTQTLGIKTAKQGIAITSLPSSGNYQGKTLTLTAGAAGVSQYNLVYISGNGTVLAAKADASGTMRCLGMAMNTASSGQSVTVLLSGVVANSGWSFTANNDLFVSAGTAGLITATAPSTATNLLQKVGTAINATCIIFNPSMDVGTL